MDEGERDPLQIPEGQVQNNENRNGTDKWVAACFVVGSTAGTGFLSLPLAIDKTGPAGFVILPLVLWGSWYTAQRLSDGMKSSPASGAYSELVSSAYGNNSYANWLVIVFLGLWYIGSSVVYLLLAAQNANKIVPGVNSCAWILIFGAVVTLIVIICTNPKNKSFQLLTFVSTALACIACIMLCVIISEADRTKPVSHTGSRFDTFTSALGIILFACGGHPAYPSIQASMEHRDQFSTSLTVGFWVMLALYLPSTIAAYVKLGDHTPLNILGQLDHEIGAQRAVIIMMSLHLLLSVSIMMYPVCAELEMRCKTNGRFIQSSLCRLFLVVLVVVLALLVPHFGILVSMIGSTLVTMFTFVFPPIIYGKSCRYQDRSPNWRALDYVIKVLGVVLCVVCTVGSSIYTYKETDRNFIDPCFVNFTQRF